MTQITIPAQVVGGKLRHKQTLPDLEGQHVIATVTAVPAAPAEEPIKDSKPPEQNADLDFDPEPPPWLEIENDVYFPMTVPSISLGKVPIKVEEGRPCIILPEELPDE